MAGRPTMFNAQRKKRFLDAIRNGVSFEAASGCAGVTKATVYKWLKLGQQKDAPAEFAAFVDEYQAALGECEDWYVGKLRKAAEAGNTSAAIFMLKAHNRDRYGDKQQVETRDRTGEPEEVSEDDIVRRLIGNPDALNQIDAILESVEDGQPGPVGRDGKPGPMDKGKALEALR